MYDSSDHAFAADNMKKAIVEADLDAAKAWLQQVTLIEAEMVFEGHDIAEVRRENWKPM